jgi:hypothetical protein
MMATYKIADCTRYIPYPKIPYLHPMNQSLNAESTQLPSSFNANFQAVENVLAFCKGVEVTGGQLHLGLAICHSFC